MDAHFHIACLLLLVFSCFRLTGATNFRHVVINGFKVQVSENGLVSHGKNVNSACSSLGSEWTEFIIDSNEEIRAVIDRLDKAGIESNVWLNPALAEKDAFFGFFFEYFCTDGEQVSRQLLFKVDQAALDDGEIGYVESNVKPCLELRKSWNSKPSQSGKHMVASQDCSRNQAFLCRGPPAPTTTVEVPMTTEYPSKTTTTRFDMGRSQPTLVPSGARARSTPTPGLIITASGTDITSGETTQAVTTTSPYVISQESTFNIDVTSETTEGGSTSLHSDVTSGVSTSNIEIASSYSDVTEEVSTPNIGIESSFSGVTAEATTSSTESIRSHSDVTASISHTGVTTSNYDTTNVNIVSNTETTTSSDPNSAPVLTTTDWYSLSASYTETESLITTNPGIVTETSSDMFTQTTSDISHDTSSLSTERPTFYLSSTSELFTISTGPTTQRDQTTTSPITSPQPPTPPPKTIIPGSTSVPVKVCACACSNQTKFINETIDDKQEEIMKTKIKQTLTIDKENLSSEKRKKESVSDSRTSSQITGILGVLFLSVVLGSIVVMDFGAAVRGLFYKCAKKRD